MSVTEKIERKLEAGKERASYERSKHPNELTNEEVLERTLAKLKESGIYEICKEAQEYYWPLGRMLELPLYLREKESDGIRKYGGVALMLRSPEGGGGGIYGGEMILVGMYLYPERVIIRSGMHPYSFPKDSVKGWTNETKEKIEEVIAESILKPGTYLWYEGMYGEELRYI